MNYANNALRLTAALVLACLAASGCAFDVPGLFGTPTDAQPPDTRPPDASPDAPPDAPPDAQPDVPPDPCLDWTFSPRHFDPCVIVDPTGGLVLNLSGEYVYNTNNGQLLDPGDGTSNPTNQILGDSRLISVNSLSINTNASLRVVGDRPLILAVWGIVSIDGSVDVTSRVAVNGGVVSFDAGAGASSAAIADCGDGSGSDGANNSEGGGGGGGGAFQGDGGDGGDGDQGDASGGAKGSELGGTPTEVRGGCPGGDGGNGAQGTIRALGGVGGGAIQITARGAITVDGTIEAGGAGGGPGNADNNEDDTGGGGGGSGGYIGLESVGVMVTGTLAANGGAGGGGAGNNAASPGQDGQPSNAAAAGGARNGGGAYGANGSAGGATTGSSVQDSATNGGGGGGGGAGFIIVTADAISVGGATVSPEHTPQALQP